MDRCVWCRDPLRFRDQRHCPQRHRLMPSASKPPTGASNPTPKPRDAQKEKDYERKKQRVKEAHRKKRVRALMKSAPGEPVKLHYDTDCRSPATEAHVVMFSGVSSESKGEIAGSSGYGWYGMPRRAGKGGAGGACANALLHYLKESDRTKPPDRSWLTTMVGMQKWLSKEGYTTVPRLSAGNNNFDFKRPFSILNPQCVNSQRLSGRTRAVLIGCNYPGTESALDGAWADVSKMKRYIASVGFSNDGDSLMVLRDDPNGKSGELQPTKENILEALHWLALGAAEGDSLLLHFSGHGVRVNRPKASETDDETVVAEDGLVPCDYKTEGPILDREVQEILVSRLPKGCSLVMFLDCCRGGSAVELPYNFKLTPKQYAFEKERMAVGWPVRRNPLAALVDRTVNMVPNNCKRALRIGAKTADATCETIGGVLQAAADSFLPKLIKREYQRGKRKIHKLTGVKVQFEPHDERTHRFLF